MIDENADGSVTVYFFGDTSGVFDRMDFPTQYEAEIGLRRNGLNLYENGKGAQEA